MNFQFSRVAVKRFAWASLIANAAIIVSGALVRLTGSGLGCPTWPRCTEDSYVPHGALGIHGAIEFGNRLITFVVGAAAILALIAIWKSAERTTLRLRLAVLIALGVPLQAVIGGFTVLSDLNPWVVGLHLVLSIIMVALAAWLVFDLSADYGSNDNVTSRLSIAAYVVLAASIYLGTVVTGAGPHAGDAEALRNGLDPETWSRLHALSMWLFAAIMVYLVWRLRAHPARNKAILVLLVTLAQGAIGYAQYFTGLPIPLVLLHLAGASVLLIVATWFLAATAKTTSPVKAA
ncbi:MAG: heme A synthase [Porphyromonadaceae bacterium]|nr:heme A synthase [Porphyromonadaceae bacterium]